MKEACPVVTDQAPAAIGPYSQAVVWNDIVYCSGQIALDPATGELVDGDVSVQTERVLRNLAAVLEAAGTGLEGALKLTVYVRDMASFGAVNEVYARFFQGPCLPARATVEVLGLPRDVLVEIDCLAAIRG